MMNYEPGSQFAEVPIFPLPDVVLFPGAVLPLHIFEPRYRTMVESALSTDRLICMVNVIEDKPNDALGHPAIRDIAGLGEIIDHERLPDGRYHLMLMGRCRVNLKELAFLPPFRRACASVLTSHGPEPDETERAVLQTAIQHRISRVRTRHPDFAFEYPDTLPVSQVVDLCGQYLITDGDIRQKLLETLNVTTRIQTCIEALLDHPPSSRHDVN